jgi:ribosomal protein S4E
MRFNIGNRVKIIAGRNVGRLGTIMDIRSDRLIYGVMLDSERCLDAFFEKELIVVPRNNWYSEGI